MGNQFGLGKLFQSAVSDVRNFATSFWKMILLGNFPRIYPNILAHSHSICHFLRILQKGHPNGSSKNIKNLQQNSKEPLQNIEKQQLPQSWCPRPRCTRSKWWEATGTWSPHNMGLDRPKRLRPNKFFASSNSDGFLYKFNQKPVQQVGILRCMSKWPRIGMSARSQWQHRAMGRQGGHIPLLQNY